VPEENGPDEASDLQKTNSKKLVKSSSEDMRLRVSQGFTRKFSIAAIPPKASFDANDEMAKVGAVLGSVNTLVTDINVCSRFPRFPRFPRFHFFIFLNFYFYF
jgi:hypothetical protein